MAHSTERFRASVTPIEHPLGRPLVVATTQPDHPAAGPAAAAVPRRLLSARTVARFALTTLVALLASLVLYLAISVPKSWFPAAAPKAFAASGLAVAHGTGQLVDDELRVTAPDSTGPALISLVPDLISSDYAAIAWIATDLPERAMVRLLWRNDKAPEKLNSIDVPVESGRTRPVMG